jgi:hypothetical protein
VPRQAESSLPILLLFYPFKKPISRREGISILMLS